MATSSSAPQITSSNPSSTSEEENYPEPINASKLSPYQVGDKVVVRPPTLQTDKIKIINLVSANVDPPSWAKGYDDIVAFL